MFSKILSLPLERVTICEKKIWQGFEFFFVVINYFRKSFGYLFTIFDKHIPPYIKQYGTVDGQIHMTLYST